MKNKGKTIATVGMLLLVVLVTIAVSYAFFTYSGQGTKENTITTGNLTFVYDEKAQAGNGITIHNAFPTQDDIGKTLSASNQMFEFQVIATTQGSPITYEVIAFKEDDSTLAAGMAKIYLTSYDGAVETLIDTTLIGAENTVTTYDQLVDTKIEGQTGKTLYQETIPADQVDYSKTFRLRMWVSDRANTNTNGSWDFNEETFSVKVNVAAFNE